jgi:hypothetical protein
MLPRLMPLAGALLALFISGCEPKPKLTPVQKEQLLATLAGLRERGVAADTKRHRGLELARNVVPRPDLGRCPIAVPMPPDMTRRHTFQEFLDVKELRLLEVETGKENPWKETGGPMWRSLGHSIGSYENDVKKDRLEDYGKDPGATLAQRFGEFEDPAKWQYDFYLLADEYVEPEMQGNGFSPGLLRGRLYVWSYPAGEIACAGDASATSSSSIGTRTFRGFENIAETINTLRMDLELESLRSALKHLFKAGPPKGG